MATAGMFAGEVTPQAPADEALTDKYKGYWWMEYGAALAGICGTVNDLDQGQLLNVSPIGLLIRDESMIQEITPLANNVSFDNTKIISLTCAFMRQHEPDSPLNIHVFQFINSVGSVPHLEFYMDSDGYVNLVGRNLAGTVILDVQITKNGFTFADSDLHLFSIVVDLNSPSRREIYHNSENITDGTWVTWNTYTDDTIQLEDLGGSPAQLRYYFGGSSAVQWGESTGGYNGGGIFGTIDSIGFVSFDDTCSLIAASVWDEQGYVRDPQRWEGWYKTQPQAFYGPSFWKNSGKTEPASYGDSNMELNMSNAYSQLSIQDEDAQINLGIGGITEAV